MLVMSEFINIEHGNGSDDDDDVGLLLGNHRRYLPQGQVTERGQVISKPSR